MPRGRVVTPDAVKETLETVDRPFATTGDVADRLDVTKQAIRNHHNELSQSPMLEHGKVGRQRVYWLAQDETPAQVTTDPEPPEPNAPEPTADRDSIETTDSSKGILERLLTDANRSSMDTPGLFILAVVVGVVGFVGLQALSKVHTAYRSANGLDTTLGDIAQGVGYAAVAVLAGVVSVFAGYAGAAVLWSYHPALTVGFVVGYVAFRAVEWRAIQPKQTTGVRA